jgi:hypothetical protein
MVGVFRASHLPVLLAVSSLVNKNDKVIHSNPPRPLPSPFKTRVRPAGPRLKRTSKKLRTRLKINYS